MCNKIKKKIKIFVACKTPSYVPIHPLLFPIQTGSALSADHFEGMLRDDDGENISKKNDRYCELTAQYWAWKNQDADYYGFFHNRRYFSFSEMQGSLDEMGNLTLAALDTATLQKIGLEEETMRSGIEPYDIVLPQPMELIPPPGEKGDYTIQKQYKWGIQHREEDLETAVRILLARYPEYAQDAQSYLDSCQGWFYNMFIMSRVLFFSYCNWLFPLLDEIDRAIDLTNASTYQLRTPGFLAERLFGIYVTHLKRTRPELKIAQRSVVFFNSTEQPFPWPAFEEKNVPVVLTASDEYAPIAAVLLESLKMHLSVGRNYDVLILDAGIRPEWRKLLEAILAGRENCALRFLPVRGKLNAYRLPVKLHLNDATYARLLLPDYLQNYHKAVYLDTDIILNADVAELFDTELGNCLFGAVRDTIAAGWCNQKGHEMRRYVTETLHLESPFDYFNGGVLVLNLEALRKEAPTRQLLAIAQSREWMWMDQDVLNLVGAGRTKLLGQEWNLMAHAGPNSANRPEALAPRWLQQQFDRAYAAPKLIHWAGHALPCFDAQADLFWYFWQYARRTVFYEMLLQLQSRQAAAIYTEELEKQVEQRRQEGIKYTLDTVYSWRLSAKVRAFLRRLGKAKVDSREQKGPDGQGAAP